MVPGCYWTRLLSLSAAAFHSEVVPPGVAVLDDPQLHLDTTAVAIGGRVKGQPSRRGTLPGDQWRRPNQPPHELHVAASYHFDLHRGRRKVNEHVVVRLPMLGNMVVPPWRTMLTYKLVRKSPSLFGSTFVCVIRDALYLGDGLHLGAAG